MSNSSFSFQEIVCVCVHVFSCSCIDVWHMFTTKMDSYAICDCAGTISFFRKFKRIWQYIEIENKIKSKNECELFFFCFWLAIFQFRANDSHSHDSWLLLMLEDLFVTSSHYPFSFLIHTLSQNTKDLFNVRIRLHDDDK